MPSASRRKIGARGASWSAMHEQWWHSVALQVALSGTRWHSVALSGTQWHSVALSGTQWHSVALSGTQWHPVALNDDGMAIHSHDSDGPNFCTIFG